MLWGTQCGTSHASVRPVWSKRTDLQARLQVLCSLSMGGAGGVALFITWNFTFPEALAPLGSLSACDVDAHSGHGASLCALTGLFLQHVELLPPFYNGSRTCGKTGSVASSVLDYFHYKKQNLNSCEWLAWCHLCCEGRQGFMTLKHRDSKEEFPAVWSTTQLNTVWDKSVFSELSRVIFFSHG